MSHYYGNARGLNIDNSPSTHPIDGRSDLTRRSARIAVVMNSTGECYERLYEFTRRHNRVYADYHGYAFHGCCYRHDQRPASWHKVPVLLELLPHYDWLFWIDADACFIDYKRDLVPFLQDRYLMVGQAPKKHPHTFNMGLFSLRSCQATCELLKAIYEQDQFIHHRWWENMALVHLLKQNNSEAERWRKSILCLDYGRLWVRPGDAQSSLCIHSAGGSPHEKHHNLQYALNRLA